MDAIEAENFLKSGNLNILAVYYVINIVCNDIAIRFLASLRSWRFWWAGKPGQNEWCSCRRNGKAGPKRVVQLRVKWGENRDSRGEAASTSGFSLPSPHFPASSPVVLALVPGSPVSPPIKTASYAGYFLAR